MPASAPCLAFLSLLIANQLFLVFLEVDLKTTQDPHTIFQLAWSPSCTLQCWHYRYRHPHVYAPASTLARAELKKCYLSVDSCWMITHENVTNCAISCESPCGLSSPRSTLSMCLQLAIKATKKEAGNCMLPITVFCTYVEECTLAMRSS